MTNEKMIAVKVFSFPKKKKVRAVSDAELDKFEQQLRERSAPMVAAIRASETLTEADYGITVTA